jgi:ABC-type oligopeptide transport system ATPase subunit
MRGHTLDSEARIRSDTPDTPGGAETCLLGYTTDAGLPVYIPDSENYGHRFIIGQSGVGKTTFANLLTLQQIQRGGGLLSINGKLDDEDLQTIYRMARYYGRERDILVLNAGDPKQSNSYNPILFGDSDEVAARVLSLIPSTETNPGADHYKQSANQGIATLVAALQKAKYAYNFMDLTILLQSPRALDYLERAVAAKVRNAKELTNLQLFTSQFRTAQSRTGEMVIDMKKLKDVFGGIGGRMYMFATNNFGEVLNSYTPELRIYDAIMDRKIVYVMLPTMGKDVAASNLGKLVVADYRTAISWVQARPKRERPMPYTLALFDEAGSYVTDSFNRIFEQSRTAHQMLNILVQTKANLDAISDELREMVLGNTWTKVFFKIGTPESAEMAAEVIGKHRAIYRSLQESGAAGRAAMTTNGMPDSSATTTMNIGMGQTEREDYIVAPRTLMGLDRGEAVVLRGGKTLYSVRVPQIEFDKKFISEAGRFEVNRFDFPTVRGIDLYTRIGEFLDGETRQQLENQAKR